MSVRYSYVSILLVLTMQAVWLPSSHAATTAERLAQIPVPFDAQVLSVGRNVQHNGQIMSLATFESDAAQRDTLAFYRQLWAQEADDGTPGMLESRAGQWLVISHLQEGYQSVLQLNAEETHRSKGFLSVMQLQDQAANGSAHEMLPGLERLSLTRSQDANRESQLSVFLSTEAVEPVARQLAELWTNRGWTLVSNEAYSRSRVLLLNRKTAQLEIVISHASGTGTLVVMNEVDDHG